jgi:uncharacterized surface protein with fasciclin (FAS1) repeats
MLRSFVALGAATVAALGLSASSARAQDIVDVAGSNPQFSTLVAAVKAAGLVETLKGPGPFTVFAPTNAAFKKIPAATLQSLLKPENKQKLVAILTYHVLPNKVGAADVKALKMTTGVKTVQGATVKVNPKALKVNNAKIIKADVPASNGVIHVIDTVLMPPMGGGAKMSNMGAAHH